MPPPYTTTMIGRRHGNVQLLNSQRSEQTGQWRWSRNPIGCGVVAICKFNWQVMPPSHSQGHIVPIQTCIAMIKLNCRQRGVAHCAQHTVASAAGRSRSRALRCVAYYAVHSAAAWQVVVHEALNGITTLPQRCSRRLQPPRIAVQVQQLARNCMLQAVLNGLI